MILKDVLRKHSTLTKNTLKNKEREKNLLTLMATQKTRQVKFLAFLILFSKVQKPIPIKTWHNCPNKTSSLKTALQCEDRASPCSAACVGLH